MAIPIVICIFYTSNLGINSAERPAFFNQNISILVVILGVTNYSGLRYLVTKGIHISTEN